MSPVRVFRPSKEEFSDFKRYINYMESQGAAKDGIAKVSKISYSMINLIIKWIVIIYRFSTTQYVLS